MTLSSPGSQRLPLKKSDAFENDHFRFGRSMPHRSRLAVFFAIEPLFGPMHGFEFEHNDAFWFPVAFQRLDRAAAHDVFAAVLLYCRAGELLVFLVSGWIDNVDFDNHVRAHLKNFSMEFTGL